ncbi:unnamed protein product [Gulo gulo]|uniref:Uncharacterized protein n=1 Tax=Gulo gulo TaxID=48420 RepID=A0A9X9LF72_GULGU|nr:unnamed protein product [Gulo gulo]
MVGFYDRRTICGFQVSLDTRDLEVDLLQDTPADNYTVKHPCFLRGLCC